MRTGGGSAAAACKDAVAVRDILGAAAHVDLRFLALPYDVEAAPARENGAALIAILACEEVRAAGFPGIVIVFDRGSGVVLAVSLTIDGIDTYEAVQVMVEQLISSAGLAQGPTVALWATAVFLRLNFELRTGDLLDRVGGGFAPESGPDERGSEGEVVCGMVMHFHPTIIVPIVSIIRVL